MKEADSVSETLCLKKLKTLDNTQNNIVTCIKWLVDGVWVSDWIYQPLIQSLNYSHYTDSAIGDLHNLQFTGTHALGFSVFTSRILATKLKLSHCDLIFESHVKSSQADF
jgi:hypothetical protein